MDYACRERLILITCNRQAFLALAGSAPETGTATWLEGSADANALTLTVRKLDGTVVHEVRVRSVG